LSRFDYDVVVIGAGINGAGVAQAAAAAGHRVLVLEKTAPAAGTSSKSSKLVHGGLRYLESYEFGLVRESLKERALLLKLAPELVRLQEFCIPVYSTTRRSPLLLRVGLSLYWLCTGFASNGRFNTVPKERWTDLNGLRTDGLRTVFQYRDARTDDAALTRAVLASAQQFDTEVICPAELQSIQLLPGGCELTYRDGSHESSCSTRVLVNAAGPWANEVVQRISPVQAEVPAELVQGAHIELPGTMHGPFFYLESPRDGRAVFVMPRNERVIVGTTETRFTAHPDQVRPLGAEENYLLGVLHHYFPEQRGLTRDDLLDSWAGLRVLPGGVGHAFHKSRETILQRDRSAKPRVLSIYGGKLTTYRTTALKVMRRIAPSLPERVPLASTEVLPLKPAD